MSDMEATPSVVASTTTVVVEIPMSMIVASRTSRNINEAQVEALAASINEVGLLSPITVRLRQDGLFEVCGGAHRFLAFDTLDRESIPAIIRSDDDIVAEIVEIDENTARAELTLPERAAALARRKTLYELVHPHTKHGAIGGGHNQSGQIGHSAHGTKSPPLESPGEHTGVAAPPAEVVSNDNPMARAPDRFTAVAAQQTRASERTVRREAALGQKLLGLLGPETVALLGKTSLKKGVELEALVRLPEQTRSELVTRATAGESVSARAALQEIRRMERTAGIALPQSAIGERLFNFFLADPIWEPVEWSGMACAIASPPSSVSQLIASRPVAAVAAEDAVLLLWSPAVMFPWALFVSEAWGFHYRAHITWSKTVTEPGRWVRNSHEILILASHGRIPAPPAGLQPESSIRGGSSERLAFGYSIANVFPELTERLQLYGTAPGANGWATWDGR